MLNKSNPKENKMSTTFKKSSDQSNIKVVIFGATGSIGRALLAQALAQAYPATALVRTPAKIDAEHANLRVVQGDVLDPASVERAMPTHNAVFCALGAGAKGRIRSEGTRNIIRAMEKADVRRLICQSTLGVGDSEGNLNWYWRYLMFGLLLRRAFADHVRQEEYVQQSDLDWTIVRPGAFTDGEHTGIYRHGFSGGDKAISLKISRADVADFMVKQLGDDTYIHATPGLSY